MNTQFLSVREIAQRYSVCIKTIYNWTYKGKFPRGVHFGHNRRWSLASLLEYEHSVEQEAAAHE